MKPVEWGFESKVSIEWVCFYLNRRVNTFHSNPQKLEAIASKAL
jgi:hypothetical protein